MNNRFPKNEAGGQKDRDLEVRKSWITRFIERKEKEQDKPVNQEVSFLDFFKGLFTRQSKDPHAKTKNWIEEAFSERRESEELTELVNTDTELSKPVESVEVIMVVAEKFRQAGARVLKFISRYFQHNRSQSEINIHANRPKIKDVSAMYEDDGSNRSTKRVGEKSAQQMPPPFDFALANEDNPTSVRPRMKVPFLGSYSGSEPLIVDDFIAPTLKPSVSSDGIVKQVSYRPTVKDLVFARVGTKHTTGSEARLAPVKKQTFFGAPNQNNPLYKQAKQQIDKLVQENIELTGENTEFEFQVENLSEQLQIIKDTSVVGNTRTQSNLPNKSQAIGTLGQKLPPSRDKPTDTSVRSVDESNALHSPSLKQSTGYHANQEKSVEVQPLHSQLHQTQQGDQESESFAEVRKRFNNQGSEENKPGSVGVEPLHLKQKVNSSTSSGSSVGGAVSVGQVIANRTQSNLVQHTYGSNLGDTSEKTSAKKQIDYKLILIFSLLLIITLYWLS